MLAHALAGLLTGLGLIVAIGAQNAFVLRQGLARDHVGVVVAICALSDLVLIVAGVAGMGAVVASHPTVLHVLKWVGALYLAWFAIGSFRSAREATGLQAQPARSRGSIVATTFALTWLNPHVYLDTVLMLGNIANQHGDGRWAFAGGAGAASVLWFSGLGFGATKMSARLANPRTWQVLDIVIGVVMLVLAAVLAFG